MDKKWVLGLLAMFVYICSLQPTWAAAVSEEAQRHFNRGMAAVEMAQTPEDYRPAIEEFQKAQTMAPDWPDVYYNLGLVQEKAGKYKEAASSLRQYLQLAPDSPDVAAVRALADKLEYKAEQFLSVPDIIDVLVSLSDERIWKIAGDCKVANADKGAYGGDYNWRGFDFDREENNAVKTLKDFQYDPPYPAFQTLKVTGPVLKYLTTRNVSSGGSYNGKKIKKNHEYTSVMEHEVTVLSKRLVKVRRIVRHGSGADGVSTGDEFSCTFEKI